MSDPQISAYGYLFNARIAGFDLDGFVINVIAFFDEVVIATLTTQEDDTLARLLAYQQSLGAARFRVVPVEMDLKANNRFDGDLKTVALQACTHSDEARRVYVIADADERFPLSQRASWRGYAAGLLAWDDIDVLALPVLDLWGSETTIREDRPIGSKLRMHKGTVVRRGVPAFAERGGGLIDTSKSDTTEPLRSDGSLAVIARLWRVSPIRAIDAQITLFDTPYVLHYGFVDAQRRAELGRTFWKGHWEARSGHAEQVATTVAELTDGVPLIPHNLPLT